jgi:putative membrane protein
MNSRLFLSKKKGLTLACTAFLATATAFGQMQQPGAAVPPGSQPTPGTQPGVVAPGMSDTASTQSMNDKAFVRDALQGGLAEVNLGQLAVQKGSSEDVKQFGQKMVDDHTKLGTAMSQVALQEGVKPPNGLSKKDKELIAKLQGLSGPQFDDAYIKAMVKDHKKDESAFKTEAEQAQDPAVRQIAQQGEPVIASHLQMIEQIAQAHHLEGGKSKSGVE